MLKKEIKSLALSNKFVGLDLWSVSGRMGIKYKMSDTHEIFVGKIFYKEAPHKEVTQYFIDKCMVAEVEFLKNFNTKLRTNYN